MSKQRQARFEKRQRWQGIMDEQSASGLSVARFCQERGLSKHTLGYWKKQLKGPRPTQPVFREVRLAPQTPAVSSCLEIVVGTLVIRVPTGFDENDLRRVLLAVAAAC
jgi:hypothetical protein